MGFYPETADVPARWVCDDMLIRPIRAADAEVDYEALISSRKMLRVWDKATGRPTTLPLTRTGPSLQSTRPTTKSERRSHSR